MKTQTRFVILSARTKIAAALSGALFLGLAACATASSQPGGAARVADEAAILSLLEAQDVAWNAGDIEGFMVGYWRSPDLRFASGGNITRGWDETLARYKARYGTGAEMGTLTTRDHEIVILSADAAIAHGKWQLDWQGKQPWGLYTLVLRKIDGEWRIVSDTTTAAD
ncbi:nuclear transport factor 2 family protein [Hyphomonas sp. WL0036]|uniref:YybH family protein n=1 Tax=Hyphomonas sediminis TaxID=2866160 RepID=UPI001C800F5E|nr:nuclear transport factor 2 family protein [Hyphomonas sediminis]MBY9065664.1 nuclear transport factor 2 family protein [Hyphomonas sediminis]